MYQVSIDLGECQIDREIRQLKRLALHRYNTGVTSDLKELNIIQKMINATCLETCVDKLLKIGYVVRDMGDEIVEVDYELVKILSGHIANEIKQLKIIALKRYNTGVSHNLKELLDIQKMTITNDLGVYGEKLMIAGFKIINPMDKVVNEDVEHIPVSVEDIFNNLLGCNSHIIPSANRKVINGLLEVENV